MRQFLILPLLAAAGVASDVPPAHAQDASVTLTKDDVDAPAGQLFALLQDFRRWNLWSPHEKAMPGVKRYYDDPLYGRGASTSWDGDAAFGAGRALVTDATAPGAGATGTPGVVAVTLDLLRPATGRVLLRFTLRPDGERTRLAATVSGPAGLAGQVLDRFFVDRGLLGLSCAVFGSPKDVCRAAVGDKVDGGG